MNKKNHRHPALPATLSRRSVLSLATATALLQACGGGGEIIGSDNNSGVLPGPDTGGNDGGVSPVPGTGGDGGGMSPTPGTAPSITTHPAGGSVTAGMPATFTVVAEGSAPLAYQWLRDGAPIAGATGSTYTLASAALADNGARFAVVVTNGSGSVTSNIATLAVSPGVGIALLAGALGGPGNIDGTGTSARFDDPRGVAVDPAGNVYIADSADHVIRKMTPAGVVTTFAGEHGQAGHADGAGSSARFNAPLGLCCDASGNVYVAEGGGQVIRRITPAGVVTTLAGQYDDPGAADGTGTAARFSDPWAIAIDPAGNLYVADAANNRIRKITPAGVVSTVAGSTLGFADGTGAAARFYRPGGIVYHAATTALYVSDAQNHRIRKVTLAGVVTTFAGSGTPGGGDATGQAATFNGPTQLCLFGDTLFVADRYNSTIRAVALDSGAVTTFAGSSLSGGVTDGTGLSARFLRPWGIGADAAGNLYVSDPESYLLRKVTPAQVVTTAAGAYYQQGSTDGTGSAARFESPAAIARDAAGHLYVADTNAIRKVTPDGAVSTFAGTAGVPGNADGTGAAARFTIPSGIVVDAAGNVYVADSSNNAIRKISPAGVVTTLCGGIVGTDDGTGSAGQFNSPAHIALDPAGNIVVADTYNHAIRRVTPAGVVTTIAGQKGTGGYVNATGTAARFRSPEAVAVDAAGNIYVADSGNNAIRKIDTAGVVTTFAGSVPGAGGTAGALGSADGTGSAARFNDPRGLTLDAAGNLYVADVRNALIRKVTQAAAVTTPLGQPGRHGVQLGAAPGSFTGPYGLTVSADGRQMWVVDETAVLNITLA